MTTTKPTPKDATLALSYLRAALDSARMAAKDLAGLCNSPAWSSDLSLAATEAVNAVRSIQHAMERLNPEIPESEQGDGSNYTNAPKD